MDALREFEELIKTEKFDEAVKLLLSQASENTRLQIERSLSNLEETKKLEGIWRDLTLLLHFAYTSSTLTKETDNQSLVSCVIASVNAIKIANELGMKSLMPKFMLNASRALIMMKMKDRAERMLLEAERVCIELNDHANAISVYNDLASLYYEEGRYLEAKSKIESAIKLAMDKISSEIANSFSIAAEVYVKLGEFENAEKSYNKAEKMLRDLIEKEKSNKFDLALLLSNYSIFRKKLGRYEEAEKMLLESLNIFEELEKSDFTFSQFVATNLRHLGDLYREMKKYSEAEQFYSRSREKFREIQKRWEVPGG
ncbi:MAG: tetratricopeptide repeat protein [Archaeoglobaceae archaeon]